MKGFSSHPKIPRTPDVQSNSSSNRSGASGDIPPLTRSISPSRPNSGGKGLFLYLLDICILITVELKETATCQNHLFYDIK